MGQAKHLYVIEGEAMAKDCISTTRDYYNEASSAIVSNMKKQHSQTRAQAQFERRKDP